MANPDPIQTNRSTYFEAEKSGKVSDDEAMNAGIPALLASNPENNHVLDFLSSFSAHSDVAERLLLSTRQLGDVQVFRSE